MINTTEPWLEPVAAELRISNGITEINGKIDLLVKSVSDLTEAVNEVRSDNKNTRMTIIVTVIAATLTTIGLVVAIQAALLQAFDTGKELAPPALYGDLDEAKRLLGSDYQCLVRVKLVEVK